MLVTAICIFAGIFCGFAHPAEESGFALAAMFLPGAILFLTHQKTRKFQFWNCTLFFSIVNLICMRWLCSHLYASALIYISYGFLCLILGLGFGCFALLCRSSLQKGYFSVFILAFMWCAIEWSRHFLFSGYPWLPLGVYAASSVALMQWGSIVGVYGLSFVTMLINLIFMQFLISGRALRGLLSISALLAGLMIAGLFRIQFSEIDLATKTSFGVIQTGIYPHHKSYSQQYFDYWVPAESMLDDWVGIIKKTDVKTILFPECVFSFSSNALHLHKGAVSLGKNGSWVGESQNEESEPFLSATTAFTMLAKQFSKQIVIGLEQDGGALSSNSHNSAYCFSSEKEMQTSAKSILVPFGEYPTWLTHLSIRLDQGGEFNFGPMKKPLFKLDCGGRAITTICFEDIFPHLIRKWFQGADIHLNITNDAWFLSSLLGKQHLLHSQLRSVENGITTLRVTSTGPSAHIDQLGRIISQTPASLNVAQPVPLYIEWEASLGRIPTLYAVYGEIWVLILILLCVFLHVLRKINLIF